MKLSLFMTPDGLISGMIESGAKLDDGTTMADFWRDFDGSEVYHEFDVPPAHDDFYGNRFPALDKEQIMQLAKVVSNAAMYTAIETRLKLKAARDKRTSGRAKKRERAKRAR